MLSRPQLLKADPKATLLYREGNAGFGTNGNKIGFYMEVV